MAATRFLAHERRFDDQTSRIDHIGLLGGAFGKSRRDFVDPADALSEPLRRSCDAGILPHHEANLVRDDLRRATVRQRRLSPALLSEHSRELRRLYEIERDALGGDEPLE